MDVSKEVSMLYLIIFLLSFFSSCTIFQSHRHISLEPQKCPEGMVMVPSHKGYVRTTFCVAKYEMKRDKEGRAVSAPDALPWVRINRLEAQTKCQEKGMGFDLISNDEWQALASNIESVAHNWARGQRGHEKGISRGHSDGIPDKALEASADDNQSCQGTQQHCTSTLWHSQRRTHQLSNGEVIWDLSGNVWEWVKDSNAHKYGEDAYLWQVTSETHPHKYVLGRGPKRSAKEQFGPREIYSFRRKDSGGLGYGTLSSRAGTIRRGGDWDNVDKTGIFSVNLNRSPMGDNPVTGFRCVYHGVMVTNSKWSIFR